MQASGSSNRISAFPLRNKSGCMVPDTKRVDLKTSSTSKGKIIPTGLATLCALLAVTVYNLYSTSEQSHSIEPLSSASQESFALPLQTSTTPAHIVLSSSSRSDSNSVVPANTKNDQSDASRTNRALEDSHKPLEPSISDFHRPAEQSMTGFEKPLSHSTITADKVPLQSTTGHNPSMPSASTTEKPSEPPTINVNPTGRQTVAKLNTNTLSTQFTYIFHQGPEPISTSKSRLLVPTYGQWEAVESAGWTEREGFLYPPRPGRFRIGLIWTQSGQGRIGVILKRVDSDGWPLSPYGVMVADTYKDAEQVRKAKEIRLDADVGLCVEGWKSKEPRIVSFKMTGKWLGE